MRTPFVAANWKMHRPPTGAFDPGSPYHPQKHVDVAVFPSFLDLREAITERIAVGAQCGRPEVSGAFTGDISMAMLKELGCMYILCGHSERRSTHGETNEDVARQARSALEVGLTPLICIGETAAQREKGKHQTIVKAQLTALPLDATILIAYEPVWAIGTGVSATARQAQEMHAFIRGLLPAERREVTRVLYGGSVTPENAQELLKQPDIDGALVGGASLKPDQFRAIVEIAARNQSLPSQGSSV